MFCYIRLFDSAYAQEILIIQKLIKTKEDKIEGIYIHELYTCYL